MPPKQNPLKLNPLQLRTLALFQEIARHPALATLNPDSGEAFLSLGNPAVWVALERKGLARGRFPHALVLTKDGLGYDTGVASQILHGADH
jgi:hypothetical protein